MKLNIWQQGWYQGAEKCESPNFGQRPEAAQIDLIVVHSISLPPGEFGNGAVQQLFTNQLDWEAHPYFQSIRGLEVSSHFFIERTGKVWQFVSCDQRAWHAGVSSALAQAYPIQHIAGHEHIAPGRKKDPGPGFDWALLQKNVAWPPQYFPDF